MITDTELNVIAALAMIGLSSRPKKRIEYSSGDRHSHDVVYKGEEQILADVAHGGAAQRSRACDSAKIAFSNVIPALSIATSVPVPIAIPTFA